MAKLRRTGKMEFTPDERAERIRQTYKESMVRGLKIYPAGSLQYTQFCRSKYLEYLDILQNDYPDVAYVTLSDFLQGRF